MKSFSSKRIQLRITLTAISIFWIVFLSGQDIQFYFNFDSLTQIKAHKPYFDNETDYALIVSIPDRSFDYKILSAKPDPKIDSKLRIGSPALRRKDYKLTKPND